MDVDGGGRCTPRPRVDQPHSWRRHWRRASTPFAVTAAPATPVPDWTCALFVQDFSERRGYVKGVVTEIVHDSGRGAPLAKVRCWLLHAEDSTPAARLCCSLLGLAVAAVRRSECPGLAASPLTAQLTGGVATPFRSPSATPSSSTTTRS